jgi:hypothetical protein
VSARAAADLAGGFIVFETLVLGLRLTAELVVGFRLELVAQFLAAALLEQRAVGPGGL